MLVTVLFELSGFIMVAGAILTPEDGFDKEDFDCMDTHTHMYFSCYCLELWYFHAIKLVSVLWGLSLGLCFLFIGRFGVIYLKSREANKYKP